MCSYMFLYEILKIILVIMELAALMYTSEDLILILLLEIKVKSFIGHLHEFLNWNEWALAGVNMSAVNSPRLVSGMSMIHPWWEILWLWSGPFMLWLWSTFILSDPNITMSHAFLVCSPVCTSINSIVIHESLERWMKLNKVQLSV